MAYYFVNTSYSWALWRSQSWRRSLWGKNQLLHIKNQIETIFSDTRKKFSVTWSLPPVCESYGLWTLQSQEMNEKNSLPLNYQTSLQAVVWPQNQYSSLELIYWSQALKGEHIFSKNEVYSTVENEGYSVVESDKSFDPQTSSYFSFIRWLKKKSESLFNINKNSIHTQSTLSLQHQEYFKESTSQVFFKKIFKTILSPEALWIKVQDTSSLLFFYILCSPPHKTSYTSLWIDYFKKSYYPPLYKLPLQGSWTLPVNMHIKHETHFSHFFKGQKILLFLRNQIPLLTLKLKNKFWAQGQWGQYQGQIACKLRKGTL